MADRLAPYGSFNFLVKFDGTEVFGGFSDVSGLSTEMVLADYRNGNDTENHVRKVPGLHKTGDVTLKRGIINSLTLFAWIAQTRTESVAAKRQVTITLLDEARAPVQSWVLRGVVPMKYTGPTLAAKTGTDVAMEELVLSAEGFDIAGA
jgi:phage tail-like protein